MRVSRAFARVCPQTARRVRAAGGVADVKCFHDDGCGLDDEVWNWIHSELGIGRSRAWRCPDCSIRALQIITIDKDREVYERLRAFAEHWLECPNRPRGGAGAGRARGGRGGGARAGRAAGRRAAPAGARRPAAGAGRRA